MSRLPSWASRHRSARNPILKPINRLRSKSMFMRDRRLWALLLVLLAGGAALWVWQGSKATQANSEALVLMSSIDLFWGEAEFNALAKGEAEPDPLYKRLAETHKLIAADNVAQLQASKGKVALLIQPRAFAPDELVRLDQWVRAGGRLLFFSYPALQWPSDLPIGDPARPLRRAARLRRADRLLRMLPRSR